MKNTISFVGETIFVQMLLLGSLVSGGISNTSRADKQWKQTPRNFKHMLFKRYFVVNDPDCHQTTNSPTKNLSNLPKGN
jgi:hypothetical protein